MYDLQILVTNEEKIKIKRLEKKEEYKHRKKVIEKGFRLGKKIENHNKEDFMIGFFVWEIKSFKLLMKTYPEEERLILYGQSNRKVKNCSYGGFYCIDKENEIFIFEKKLKFLLEYSQYVEIDFIRLYGYNFSSIKEGYQLLEISNKQKEIIKFLSKRREEEKEKIILLVMFVYLNWVEKYFYFQKLLKI